MQAVLDRWVEPGLIPSLSAAVIVPGTAMWDGAAGLADISTGMPAERDTSYALGSITKTYVAAAVLKLAEEGRLSLDDGAAHWLDEPSIANGATIRQLLGMRSGIAEPYAAIGAAIQTNPSRIWAVDDVLAHVGPPTFAAGERYEYSNANYLLLGQIAERAGGQDMAELLRGLLDPLNLNRTMLAPDQPAEVPIAHGYVEDADGRLHDIYAGELMLPTPAFASFAWTAGGISAPAWEVARWGDALYGGRAIGSESLAEMLDFRKSTIYGLGAMQTVLEGGVVVYGHGGAAAGYSTLMVHEPSTAMTVAVLANKGDFLEVLSVARQLMAVALGAEAGGAN